MPKFSALLAVFCLLFAAGPTALALDHDVATQEEEVDGVAEEEESEARSRVDEERSVNAALDASSPSDQKSEIGASDALRTDGGTETGETDLGLTSQPVEAAASFSPKSISKDPESQETAEAPDSSLPDEPAVPPAAQNADSEEAGAVTSSEGWDDGDAVFAAALAAGGAATGIALMGAATVAYSFAAVQFLVLQQAFLLYALFLPIPVLGAVALLPLLTNATGLPLIGSMSGAVVGSVVGGVVLGVSTGILAGFLVLVPIFLQGGGLGLEALGGIVVGVTVGLVVAVTGSVIGAGAGAYGGNYVGYLLEGEE